MILSERLPPGFRFSPTNQELIMYYLKKKVLGKRIYDGVISELDIYKYVPWDLPNLACLQSRDLIWYFLCPRLKKRGNSGSTRRVVGSGFWKITGNGRPVRHKGRDVGEIKTLTYYTYEPGGSGIDVKTEWTMHEYRLVDPELNGVVQDSYVLTKIFEKSGPGPMNGADYGAPFEEEEWEDDDDKKETEPIVASLTDGPSAGSKNQQGPPAATARILVEQGPPAATAGILLERTEGPSPQEGLAVTGISELIEGSSRSKNQEDSAATGIFERGNHSSGLVSSSSDQQVSHGNGVMSFMDLVMTDPNAHEKTITASGRPQGQFPMIDYDDNAIVMEQLLALFDNNNDAVQESEGRQGRSSAATICDAVGTEERSDVCSDADMLAGQDQVMQGPDGIGDDLFDGLEDFLYPTLLNNPGYIPEYPPAESTYPDGNFLEERDIDGANIWSNGCSFINDSGV